MAPLPPPFSLYPPFLKERYKKKLLFLPLLIRPFSQEDLSFPPSSLHFWASSTTFSLFPGYFFARTLSSSVEVAARLALTSARDQEDEGFARGGKGGRGRKGGRGGENGPLGLPHLTLPFSFPCPSIFHPPSLSLPHLISTTHLHIPEELRYYFLFFRQKYLQALFCCGNYNKSFTILLGFTLGEDRRAFPLHGS